MTTKDIATMTYARYSAMRDKAGLSDFAVSKQTQVPASTISDWKNGLSTPKIDKLARIASLFGESLDSFIDLNGG